MESWHDSDIVYNGTILRLRVGNVTLDDGSLAHREVVEHDGGVCIVPYTGDSVILVRQFRIALGKYLLEAPAGKLEGGDKDPQARAEAELEEETGHRARTIIPLGAFYSSVGFCSEEMHLYLGLDLEKTEQRLDEEERIELVEMPIEEVRQRLRSHAFQDTKTVVVLQALVDYIEGSK